VLFVFSAYLHRVHHHHHLPPQPWLPTCVPTDAPSNQSTTSSSARSSPVPSTTRTSRGKTARSTA
jgi:hypothetical protein